MTDLHAAALIRRSRAVGDDFHVRYVPRSVAEDRAVAELLDATDPDQTAIYDLLGNHPAAVWLRTARDALASAILHTDQHDGEGK